MAGLGHGWQLLFEYCSNGFNTMHVIRLRDPWTAAIVSTERSASDATTAASTIVYSRKFHRPTDAEDQSIRLRIVFLPATDPLDISSVKVLVNGAEAHPPPLDPLAELGLTADSTVVERYFDLVNLAPFNQLELQIVAHKLDSTTAPRFGTFVIQSVELQIQ